MYKPKTMTILSLATGDVLMALFPMVVTTLILFNAFIPPSCSFNVTYTIYMPYLITFVFGLGLMVLGLEIVQHHKISSLSKNSKLICSLIASSIPWILGLIIILPLGLANIDMDTCKNSQTIDQFKALIVLGILLPACGAVITSFIVKCIDQARYQQLVSSHPQVMVDLNTGDTAHDIDNGNPHGNSFIVPIPMGNLGTADDLSLDSTQRRNRLLVISIIYFILVTPLTIFVLGFAMNPNAIRLGVVASATLTRLVYWLNVIRSVITPILMYSYSDK
ncbi:unnamed protein product [Lymnaea stagnalis]|uniref:G-protein coupled receptors family 1 profile domain-containing protein n=1 Tax=Lymnaea stagnalis TaxID=6523 RepID=A0AAV2INE0_LYMST